MTSEVEQAASAAARRRDEALEAEPTLRRARGVVHTPTELARFAVGRLDASLRRCGLLEHGLASGNVAVLDPAVGTGVWLAAVLDVLGSSSPPPAVMIGIDVDPRAVTAARSVLEATCAARGVPCDLRVDNTLELASPWPSACADSVRVVVGNPPWAARSLSRGTTLSDAALADFRRGLDGAPLAERRMGVLSDDYVRFFRWAAEQARLSPIGGAIRLATSSSFLDGPIHRGMRARLLEWFDDIELWDLGGNALLPRTGARDDNVFGVRPGVVLTIATRTRQSSMAPAIVTYARLRGSRTDKLASLASFALPHAEAITPHAPLLRFVPTKVVAASTDFLSLAEIFPFHREGVQTNRDALCVAESEAALLAKLRGFARGQGDVTASRHFDPARARRDLAHALEAHAHGEPGDLVARLAYRPFDTRWFSPHPAVCHRARPELRAAVSHSSVSLLSSRKDRGAREYNLFACATELADACFLSTRSSCRTRVFPERTPDGEPNLTALAEHAFAERIAGAVDARSVLLYCLGLLAASSFRREHDEQLRADYPRILLPPDRASYEHVAAAGAQLAFALGSEARDSSELSGPAIDDARLRQLELGHVRPFATTRDAARLAAAAAWRRGLECAQSAYQGLQGRP